MYKRYPISVCAKVYTKIKEIGRFGESFSDVIERILNSVPEIKGQKTKMKPTNQFSFTGQRCKNDEHNLCQGAWEGFDILLYCDCKCHPKKENKI